MSKKNQSAVETTESVEQVIVTEQTAPVTETKELIAADGSQAEQFIKEQGSVSKAIRTLAEAGMSRAAIGKALNKRYQHVRNVLITPLKKA